VSLSLKESGECFSTSPTTDAGKETTISPVTFTRQSLGFVLLNITLQVSWNAIASGTPAGGFFAPVVVLVGVVEGVELTSECPGEVGVVAAAPKWVWLWTSGDKGVFASGFVPR
jgi:hypothetical protein